MMKIVWLVGLIISAGQSFAQTKKPVRVKLDDTGTAVLSARLGPYLDVRVDKPDQLVNACKIYTGQFRKKGFTYAKFKITKVNSTRARVPYLVLSQAFKRVFLKTLWPKDKLVGKNWHHKVIYNHETLWTVAQMYTGFGNNYKKIQRHNGMRGHSLRKGMLIKIPEAMLMELIRVQPDLSLPKPPDPEFAVQTQTDETVTVDEAQEDVPVVTEPGENTRLPPKPKPRPKPRKEPSKEVKAQLVKLNALRKQLRWGSDSQGRYAEYHLKEGEAIYSAVVMRFCGLVVASHVFEVADKIVARNRIADVRDMAIGQAIRIPYEHLENEFKAPNDPDYLAFLNNMEDVGRVSTSLLANNLEGVYLILDAGHGGRDPGADRQKVWEDDYVYDIVCRVKERVETETAATVYTTIMDPSVKYKVQNVTRFRRDKDEILLTTPRYRLTSAGATRDGVNLRWMLANNRYYQLRKRGVKSQNVIFASFHADALHPSLRGSMIYIPDGRAKPESVNVPNGRLRKYEERIGNNFNFSRPMLREAQARSMAFAGNLIRESRNHGILVHSQKPVRSLIYKNPRHPFVPAVLRYNRVPTRLLVEVCNLNNPKDRELLKKPEFRQQVADAFTMAVYRTYGVKTRKAVSSLSNSAPAGGDR
ncbi:MAG: N-acetylmuramoyl-L-alanine amidase [Acidobacteriota bacterium]|nr:N-acetylmuramoyl-L-alanine amidase [Acidobacteriota bacterium]